MNPELSHPLEFSRPVAVDGLPQSGRKWTIEATPEECARLARRFGILAVNALTATFTVKPVSHGDVIRVTGTMTADVVQACVATLTPVEQRVVEDIDLPFSETAAETQGDIDMDLSLDDPPEPIYDGKVDLGEVAAEHLALGLDPFPRADNAEFIVSSEGCDDSEERTPSPFAKLEALKKKNSSQP